MSEAAAPNQANSADAVADQLASAVQAASAPVSEKRLHDDTSMDAVTLIAGDLELMSSYYENALALEPLTERAGRRDVQRVLGRGNTPLVRLVHSPDLPAVDPRQAGLYHSAFLFENEASLSATVYRAAQDPRSRFVGSSDHLVSEAFYFTDPEGNGIELYRDRPRDQWRIINGQTQMDTIYLDPNAYLQKHLTEDVLNGVNTLPGEIGHIHLQVGDIKVARDFYVDVIGFDVTFDGISSALFASAGGYHHHIGMNVWHSQGAGPRAATLGLGDVSVTVPDRENLDALALRLQARGLQFTDDGRAIVTRDPWNTQITVTLPGATADELLTN